MKRDYARLRNRELGSLALRPEIRSISIYGLALITLICVIVSNIP